VAARIFLPAREGSMSEISTLESLAELWERVDYIGLFLVFLGVTVESLVEFTNLIKSSFLKPRIGKVSALILIVGLALELISSSRLSAINRQVVETLSRQAADAENRAAHAEKATEEERAARVKLEAEVGHERLSRKHQ
jgi:hypothetical protein